MPPRTSSDNIRGGGGSRSKEKVLNDRDMMYLIAHFAGLRATSKIARTNKTLREVATPILPRIGAETVRRHRLSLERLIEDLARAGLNYAVKEVLKARRAIRFTDRFQSIGKRNLDISGDLKLTPTAGANAIARFLKSNEVITELVLVDNNFPVAGAKALASALRVNTALTNLVLWDNNIGAEGAKALASALRINEVLTLLELGRNGIGDEGAKALASTLRVNKVLTELDLTNNGITNTGAEALASALRVNGSLKSLWLPNNRIGNEGAVALASALRVEIRFLYPPASEKPRISVSEGGLTKLDLRFNSFCRAYNDEGRKAINDAVSQRRGFQLKM
ncbi:hypothetical protein EMVG_00179 [Emiliania huxleyi virus PS401]|nr:hypothetical protein EMVG_00179 [Emiliania huxleyi virus PS401]